MGPTRPNLPDRRRPLSIGSFFTGPLGYLLLCGVAVVALWTGTGSKAVTPQAARIAHLESIIRCPSCADLSIADSETTSASGLRVEVARLVRAGLSDQQVEARVEVQFPGTLLVPGGAAGLAVFWIPTAVILAGALTLAVLLVRRTSRRPSGDVGADEALVETARRELEWR